MENKYYTPSIDEFHVGFEFESNYVLFNNTGGEEWKKVVMSEEDFEWFHDAYKHDAYSTEFRVKYLDREDIESLGFKYYRSGNYNYITHSLKKVNNDDRVTICNYGSQIFFGSIKNKSELIKVLKQLDVK